MSCGRYRPLFDRWGRQYGEWHDPPVVYMRDAHKFVETWNIGPDPVSLSHMVTGTWLPGVSWALEVVP